MPLWFLPTKAPLWPLPLARLLLTDSQSGQRRKVVLGFLTPPFPGSPQSHACAHTLLPYPRHTPHGLHIHHPIGTRVLPHPAWLQPLPPGGRQRRGGGAEFLVMLERRPSLASCLVFEKAHPRVSLSRTSQREAGRSEPSVSSGCLSEGPLSGPGESHLLVGHSLMMP